MLIYFIIRTLQSMKSMSQVIGVRVADDKHADTYNKLRMWMVKSAFD